MSQRVAISAQKVYKNFRLPHEKETTIKGAIINGLRGKKNKTITTQRALKNISFEVKDGEFFGIVGRNGSGKSTLLKILAGIYQPSKGSVQVNGRLVPFIELGVGFNSELTGRENVYLNGAMLGFSRKEIDSMYEQIVEFAELEKSMDQKLKNYSSGMQVRLAFSMAIRAEAEILLVDEVLAVGDADFQRKCFDYFRKLKKNKKTVVFVTHDMSAVVEYCDRAMLIDDSKVVSISTPQDIAMQYNKMFNQLAEDDEVTDNRWGDAQVRVEKVSITPKSIKKDTETLEIKMTCKAHADVEEPIIGFSVKNAAGQQLFGTNTKIKKVRIGDMVSGEERHIVWTIPNVFSDGKHFVDVAISRNDGVSQHDWWEQATSFRVYNDEKTPYNVNPEVKAKLL